MSVLKLAPNFTQKIEVLYKLANIFGKTYQLDQAINYFKLTLLELSSTTEDKKKLNTLIKLGICHEEKKDYEEALRSYESALEINKENVKALLHVAWCNFLMQNYSKVIEYANIILSSRTVNSDAYYIKGRALLQFKKYTEAQECFNLAIQNDQNNSVFVNSLGITKCHLGEYTKAHAEFSKVFQANPKNAEVLLNIGMMYEINKRYEDAKSSYEKALSLVPNCTEAIARNNALKNDNKLSIEFIHLEYRVPDSMIPLKGFLHSDFQGRGSDGYLVKSSSTTNSNLGEILRGVEMFAGEVGREAENDNKEEDKLVKRENKKGTVQAQPRKIVVKLKGFKNYESKNNKKKTESSHSKIKNDSSAAKEVVRPKIHQSPRPSAPKTKSAEVQVTSQQRVTTQTNPNQQLSSPDFNSAIPMQQVNMMNQLPVQAMLNPYELSSQGTNKQMMTVYMQNPMLGAKYSIVSNPSSMPFIPVVQLQRPSEVPSLYQIPQGGMMLSMTMPYGLPNGSQMPRPDNSSYILTAPAPAYLSPEQYQEQASNLQRMGTAPRSVAPQQIIAPSFYPMIGGYPGRVAVGGRLPEGFVGIPAEGIRNVELEQQEEHNNSHGRQRRSQQNSRANSSKQSKSNTGLKKPRYE